MATYHDIMAGVALRVNALSGTDAAALQTTYATRPLTTANFISSIFPFNAARDAILNTEEKLVTAVGYSTDRSLRAYVQGFTDPLSTGDMLPSVDDAGVKIVGNLGAVIDSTDDKPLTRKPIPYVQNRLNAPDLYLVDAYNFALSAGQILHTRNNVIVECCVYDAVAQLAAFDADDSILLPDSLADAYVQGACALLVRDDEFLAQSTQYGNFFVTALASIPVGVLENSAT